MKRLRRTCPRCGGKNGGRVGRCRRCRARLPFPRPLEAALRWAGALR